MKLEAYIRHPVVFFVAEKKPDEFASIDSKVFYDQFLYRNPSWHAALNLAWDVDGSAKMLEPHEDLSIIEDGDVMIYTGKSSKLVADYFSGQCPDLRSVQSKKLFDQEKKKEFLASLNLRVR